MIISQSMNRNFMSAGKYRTITSFEQLELPQTMDEVIRVADKYGIDISNYKIMLKMDADLIKSKFTGGAWENGEIDLYPLAFADEEALARTLYHESLHQRQYEANGYDTVRLEYMKYEKITVQAENKWWGKVSNNA